MPLSSYLCISIPPLLLTHFISRPSVSHLCMCSYMSLSFSCWTLQSVGMALWSQEKSVIVDPRWWVPSTSCMITSSLTFWWIAPSVSLWAPEAAVFAGTQLKFYFHVCGCRSVPVMEEPAVKSAHLPMMPCAVMDSAAVAARWVHLYNMRLIVYEWFNNVRVLSQNSYVCCDFSKMIRGCKIGNWKRNNWKNYRYSFVLSVHDKIRFGPNNTSSCFILLIKLAGLRNQFLRFKSPPQPLF